MLKGEEIRGLADSLSISFDAVAKLLPAIASQEPKAKAFGLVEIQSPSCPDSGK